MPGLPHGPSRVPGLGAHPGHWGVPSIKQLRLPLRCRPQQAWMSTERTHLLLQLSGGGRIRQHWHSGEKLQAEEAPREKGGIETPAGVNTCQLKEAGNRGG